MFRFIHNWRARSRFVKAWRAGDWESAIKACEQLLKEYPQDYQLHNNLGAACLEAGDATRAESSFRRANELSEHAVHWNNLGRALLWKGGHADAEAAFRRASELDRSDPQPQYNLTVCLREAGRTGEAVEALRRFLMAFPDHAGGHNDWACLTEERGDREQALASFARSVELAPAYLPARLNLIRLLCDLGRYPEATPHLRAVAVGGVQVRVNATDSVLEIDLDGKSFYRGPGGSSTAKHGTRRGAS